MTQNFIVLLKMFLFISYLIVLCSKTCKLLGHLIILINKITTIFIYSFVLNLRLLEIFCGVSHFSLRSARPKVEMV